MVGVEFGGGGVKTVSDLRDEGTPVCAGRLAGGCPLSVLQTLTHSRKNTGYCVSNTACRFCSGPMDVRPCQVSNSHSLSFMVTTAERNLSPMWEDRQRRRDI